MRHHLGELQLKPVVRMLGIADGVFAVGHVDGIVRHHLHVPTMQDTVVFRGYEVGYERLLGLEVVFELLHVVGLLALCHHGAALPFAGQAVIDAFGIDGGGVHVVFHELGGELHVLVGDGHVAIIINEAVAVGEDFHDGVARGGERRLLEGTLAEQGYGIQLVDGVGPVEGIPPRKFQGIKLLDLLLGPDAVLVLLTSTTALLCGRVCADKHQDSQKDECQYVTGVPQKQLFLIFARVHISHKSTTKY